MLNQGTPVGYEFLIDDKIVGSVEVINAGAVWILGSRLKFGDLPLDLMFSPNGLVARLRLASERRLTQLLVEFFPGFLVAFRRNPNLVSEILRQFSALRAMYIVAVVRRPADGFMTREAYPSSVSHGA